MQLFGFEISVKRIPPAQTTPAMVVLNAVYDKPAAEPPVKHVNSTNGTSKPVEIRTGGRPKGRKDTGLRAPIINKAVNLRQQVLLAIATGSTTRDKLAIDFKGLYEYRQIAQCVCNARIEGLVTYDGDPDSFALTEKGRAWLRAKQN